MLNKEICLQCNQVLGAYEMAHHVAWHKKQTPLCPKHSAGLACEDPACRYEHFATCEGCGYSIDDTDLVMAGRNQDIPLHEHCAVRRYPNG